MTIEGIFMGITTDTTHKFGEGEEKLIRTLTVAARIE